MRRTEVFAAVPTLVRAMIQFPPPSAARAVSQW